MQCATYLVIRSRYFWHAKNTPTLKYTNRSKTKQRTARMQKKTFTNWSWLFRRLLANAEYSRFTARAPKQMAKNRQRIWQIMHSLRSKNRPISHLENEDPGRIGAYFSQRKKSVTVKIVSKEDPAGNLRKRRETMDLLLILLVRLYVETGFDSDDSPFSEESACFCVCWMTSWRFPRCISWSFLPSSHLQTNDKETNQKEIPHRRRSPRGRLEWRWQERQEMRIWKWRHFWRGKIRKEAEIGQRGVSDYNRVPNEESRNWRYFVFDKRVVFGGRIEEPEKLPLNTTQFGRNRGEDTLAK